VKSPDILSPDALACALAVRDLTDPSQGPHAVQRVLDATVKALARSWQCEVLHHRASPIVSADHHYARLHDSPQREAGSTRWISGTELLRARTAAMIPPLLQRLGAAPPEDVLLTSPGVVYRRGAGDRLQAREPHQVDLWRIRRGERLDLRDMAWMIGAVAGAALPGFTVSTSPATAPHLLDARQIDVRVRGEWLGVGACGQVKPALLAEAGLPADAHGIAMWLDLDRLVALAKGLDDVRLLRSRDPRVARQMLDLAPYVPAAAADAPRCATLDEVRASIDEVDGRIVDLLAERRAYVLQAARFKESAEAVRVPAREAQVIANVKALAYRAGIEPDLVETLYREMIDGFVRLEVAAHRRGAVAG
jgi:phenylalanyl-tRNA synthetase alpha chain